MKKSSRIIIGLALSILFVAPVLLTWAGLPPGIILRPAGLQWYIRGAHNTALNEYYVVWADGGPFGDVIGGMRLAADGSRHPTDIDPKLIGPAPSIAPDIAYNPNANEYLLVYSSGVADNGDLHGRFLDGNGNPIGAPFVIFAGLGTQTFPSVVYNATNDYYVVGWTRLSNALGARVVFRAIAGTSAAPVFLSDPIQLEATPRPLHPHSVRIDWNETTNTLFFSWTGLAIVSGKEVDTVRAQLLHGSNGAAITPPFTVGFGKIPAVAANPNNGDFLIAFDTGVGPGLDTWATIFNSSGAQVVPPFIVSATNVPDWRIHAAFNQHANSYLVTFTRGRGCGGSGPCDDVLGRTVAPNGVLGDIFGVGDAPPPDSGLLEDHGIDDGFGTWTDLIPSTSGPSFLEFYHIDHDNLNAGLVNLGPPSFNLTTGTNQAVYGPGQTLVASTNVFNPGTSATVDIYFGVVLPDGNTVVYFTDTDLNAGVGSLSDVAGIAPMMSGVDLSGAFSMSEPSFLQYNWVGNEPAGVYELFFVATVAGSLADGIVNEGDVVDSHTVHFQFVP